VQQRVINNMAVTAQGIGAFEVDRVPKHDSGCDQVEAAGLVALLLEAAVTDFASAVEKYGASQRVAGFAVVQSGSTR
jgi:hypothetical protein